MNSHADGTDSLPFYEGILSRVVHPTNLVAFPEHRTLTVTAASLATVGGLSLILRAGVEPHSAPGGDGPSPGRETDRLFGPSRH